MLSAVGNRAAGCLPRPQRCDASSPARLPLLCAETVLALMRNPDYCLYGFAKSKRERSAEEAETAFNQLSLQVGSHFNRSISQSVNPIDHLIVIWRGRRGKRRAASRAMPVLLRPAQQAPERVPPRAARV